MTQIFRILIENVENENAQIFHLQTLRGSDGKAFCGKQLNRDKSGIIIPHSDARIDALLVYEVTCNECMARQAAGITRTKQRT